MSKELKEKIKEYSKAFKKSKENLTNSYINLLKWEYSQVKEIILSIDKSVDKLVIIKETDGNDEGRIDTAYFLYLKKRHVREDDFSGFDWSTLSIDDERSFRNFIDSFYSLMEELKEKNLDIDSILEESDFKIKTDFWNE